MSTDETDVLLVGGGVSAVRCARTLRREGFDGRILLVGDESMLPYNRPPLSKELLRDDLPDDLVLAEPSTWYARRGIDLLTGRRVVSLDLDASQVTLEDGAVIRFERCLLTTGAEPRRLRVPGAEHALLLRTVSDARRIRASAVEAEPGARVAVIGGGFIGLEVASSLATLGLRPVVLELGDALWSGSLGQELSAWAVRALAAVGVDVRLGAGVTRLGPGVAWVGDDRIDAAFVVAGIGVVPRVELADAAGLAVDDGVVTDAAHRTSHGAVWAAGDVARRAGRRIEHWHAAREGGERVARAMLGLDVGSDPAPWVFSDVAGTTLDVVGVPDGWEDEVWVVPERVLAHVQQGSVVQLTSIGSAIPPDVMRSLVAGAATIAAVRESVVA